MCESTRDRIEPVMRLSYYYSVGCHGAHFSVVPELYHRSELSFVRRRVYQQAGKVVDWPKQHEITAVRLLPCQVSCSSLHQILFHMRNEEKAETTP